MGLTVSHREDDQDSSSRVQAVRETGAASAGTRVIVGGVTRLRDAAYLGGWAYRRARFRSRKGDRKPILERNRTAACERAPRLGFTAAGQYRYVRLGAR